MHSGSNFDTLFKNSIDMKTDKYTKILLTVIAICLINLSFKGVSLFPKAYAGSPETKEIQYGLVPLNEDGSITVRLSNHEEIDVNIRGINTWDEMKVDLSSIGTSDDLSVDIANISTNDELEVNIEEVGGSGLTGLDGVPVRIVK